VEEVDANVGRLITKLKALGLEKDTIVIVTSDNGPWFEGSAGPLRDRKGGAGFDGGYRVPFLIWGPGHIPRGKTSDAISMNIGILPSLVAMSGGQIPAGLLIDGKDMSAHWQQGRTAPNRDLVLFDNEKVAAIRHDRWKFVGRSYYRSYDVPLSLFGSELLFDVVADPAEAYNLASAHPTVLKDMRARFEDARKTFEPLAKRPIADKFLGR
jgi:arylsulfatase A